MARPIGASDNLLLTPALQMLRRVHHREAAQQQQRLYPLSSLSLLRLHSGTDRQTDCPPNRTSQPQVSGVCTYMYWSMSVEDMHM